ncbi:hypothetical protein N7470_008544, partial [Penicillium chermesinum]
QQRCSHNSSSGSHLNDGPQQTPHGPLSGYSPWLNSHAHSHSHDHTVSFLDPRGSFPSASPLIHDAFTQDPDFWASPGNMPFPDTDWNILSLEDAAPFLAGFDGADFDIVNDPGYGVASTPSLLFRIPDPMSSRRSLLRHGRSYSNASPASQIPTSVSNSPATSQGDDVLSRVDASRVEKRRLNTLAARRCRQRRVDRLKSVEDELELVRKERDELRLRVSKLEGKPRL